MAYNNYFPMSYQQYQPQMNYQQPQYQQAQQNNGIVWVQGEAGAKSYLVGAGQSVLLMDSESSSFYIKSTDNSGMPMPLRIFDYTERTQPTQTSAVAHHVPEIDMSAYMTKDEFKDWADNFKASIKSTRAKKEVNDGE